MKDYRITEAVSARIPTELGEYTLWAYRNNLDDKEHLAITMGQVKDQEDVLVRVHSECFTGDVLASRRCDCGEQLHRALATIAAAGQGVLIYMRQEGRGIGLIEKLRAYNLQDQGYDTVEANLVLGHQADERVYTMAGFILEHLGVRSIRLLTNNPSKIQHLQELGVQVNERLPIQPTINADNAGYIHTKIQRMNHMLNLEPLAFNANGSDHF